MLSPCAYVNVGTHTRSTTDPFSDHVKEECYPKEIVEFNKILESTWEEA